MNVVGITSLQPNPGPQPELQPMTGPTVTTSGAENTEQVGPQNTGKQAGASGITTVSQSKAVDPAELQKSVVKLNQMLASSNTKVEVDPREPANEIWLNLVDKTTGEVIQKFPPEGLREFMLSQQPKGLALDTQR